MPDRINSLHRSIAFVLITLILAGSLSVFGNSLPELKAGRPIELKDYYRFQTVGSPAISPDGRYVAYVKTSIDEQHNTRIGEIWLATTDGSVPRKRVSSPWGSASAPRWSPESKVLSYVSRVRNNASFD